MRGYGVILSVTVATHSAHQSLAFPRASHSMSQWRGREGQRNDVMHHAYALSKPRFCMDEMVYLQKLKLNPVTTALIAPNRGSHLWFTQ